MIPKDSEYFKNVVIYSPLSKKKLNDQFEIQTMISKLYCEGYYNSIDFKCQLISIDNILNIFSNGNQSTNSLPDISISFIEFKSPLHLIEGVKHCLQTNVYQTSKKEYKALFHFKDNKTGEWVLGSSGNFQLFNSNSNSNVNGKIEYNVDDIISNKCNLTKLSIEELYNRCKIISSLNFNGVFRGVEECYVGIDCTLSKVSLKLPFEIQSSSSSFLFPSIIDSCFHSIYALIDKQGQYVFDYCEGIKYYSSSVPIGDDKIEHTHFYSLTTISSRNENSYFIKVVAFLSNGTVIFEIDNAVITSTIPLKDPLKIDSLPTNELFSSYLQSKDSLIPTPSYFNDIYSNESLEESIFTTDSHKYESFISSTLFVRINSRCPEITIDLIKSFDINQLKTMYCNQPKHERLFTFVFESLKKYYDKTTIEQQQWNESNIKYYWFYKKSTRIISKILFPLPNEDMSIDNPQSLFDNGLLDSIYSSTDFVQIQNQMVSEIIQKSIKPILNEKMVFRILEFGSGICSLSILVLDKINSLLIDNPNYQIDIEYTWSDISTSFIPDAKLKLSKFNNNINIIYKQLNLEKPLFGDNNQELKPSYYDFVIMSNVLHVIKNIKYGIDQIYKLLVPNGHLLFVEPNSGLLTSDGLYGGFDQWWSFEDTDIRKDRCCMKQESWLSLLKQCNFNNDIKLSKDSICFVIQAQKPSLLSELTQQQSNNDNNIIIYGNNESFINQIIDDKVNYKVISTIQEFNEQKNCITNNSVIYFIKSIDLLNLNNFKEITFEYIQLNQIILQLQLKCKHVLITCDSDSSNYFSSSLIGAANYFNEFGKNIDLLTLNFDFISLNSSNDNCNLSKMINMLTNLSNNYQREFIIRNHKVYFERFKNELNLKENFKSDTFESSDSSNVITQYNSQLELELVVKENELKSNQVEVDIISRGINYKDYLIYTGLVDSNLMDLKTATSDVSGIITKVGSDVSNEQFKIGDLVYGQFNNSISNVDRIQHKPTNITHIQAASIPSIYITSYHCFYNIGNLKPNQSVLIHSATGGVGLAALELLKWKKHKGLIFCTVGSLEKEQYLIENYGGNDFITGIYSTRNKDYFYQIKQKVIELGKLKINNKGVSGGGIDLILNTLSSNDYMDSNFKCLNNCGKIVDLSITHLNSNEYIDNKKFKYNFGYHNVEISEVDDSIIKECFSIISNAISNSELNIIPIKEYSGECIKNAVEFINERKHIGKIVVNFDTKSYKTVKKSLKNEMLLSDNITKYSLLKSNYKINSNLLGKNIIITGQTGLALEVLKWIIKYSDHDKLENIIILSKSSLKWELELLINKTIKLSNNKIKFHYKSVDIGNYELVDKSITEILSINPDINNIDSIFHYTFTQTSCDANEISINHLNIAHGPKSVGAINLHNLSISRGWKLINFVMASSVTSFLGSYQQCGYVSANNVLDSLSKYRVSIGLPSIAINYGLFNSTGFVSRNDTIGTWLKSDGYNPISTNTILSSLDLQLQNQLKCTNSLLCSFSNDFKSPHESLISKFDYLFNIVKQNNNNNKIQI